MGSRHEGDEGSTSRLRAALDELDTLADADPLLAAEQARLLLDRRADDGHPLDEDEPDDDDLLIVASCERVLAIAAVRTADVASAEHHVTRATAAAEVLGDPTMHGRVLLTATSVAATAGDVQRALELVDDARRLLSGQYLVRADLQRATVLMVSNRNDEAIEIFLDVLERGGIDRQVDVAKLTFNLGSLLLRIGRAGEAIEHLDAAHRAHRGAGNRDFAAACALHLADAYSQLGDHAAVFELHRQLELDGALSDVDPRSLLDLGRIMLGAGLVDEAHRSIAMAARLVEGSPTSEVSLQIGLAEARLRRRMDDPSAVEAARATLRDAEQIGDEVMQLRARVELVAAGPPEPTDVDILLGVAERCRSLGLDVEAVDAEILALERARTDPARARSIVDRVDPIEAAVDDPVARARIRHRRALLACCRGEFGEARREAATALRGLERVRARLGSTELRVAAADRAPELADLGVELAVASGRPRDVLAWAERQRAASLRFSQPDRTSVAALDLDEYRAADDAERRAAVERRITAQTRMRRTSATVERTSSAAEIRAALATGATLLEYVIVGPAVFALVVTPADTRLVPLTVDVSELEVAIGKLLFGLRRASSTTGPPAESAFRMVAALADRLDQWLLPGSLDDGDGEVVVVPSGALHSLPWSVLPRLRGRDVVIAPSAHAWSRVASRDDRRQGVLVASGPGLPEAAAEVDDVTEAWHGRATPMPMATTTQLAAALDGVSVVHLASHGRFRTDSPQFSSLELADGDFTVLDLDALDELPSVVVLSACELGSVDVRIGDDLLGFPAALLARGVRSLVAALVPVEDRASRNFAGVVHRHLAGGASVASAVRSARVALWDADPAHRAAAASFSCFGAG